MFEADPFTEGIVIFGEIGFVAGGRIGATNCRSKGHQAGDCLYRWQRLRAKGHDSSHAGAIIEGGRGTHAGKVKALRKAGANGGRFVRELPDAVVEILEKMKGQSLMSEADRKATWNTAITRIEPNRVGVRGIRYCRADGTRPPLAQRFI